MWRVGHQQSPWDFTSWEFATAGRFDGRWDDPDGVWRSLYVAETELGCYLEVLARFRPDPATVSALDAIDGDTDDHGYPTIGPGVVTADWRKRRMIGCGQLTGMFFVPALTKSLAALRKAFMSRAAELGVPDVDAAAVRLARPRALTQEISQWAYKAQFDTPGAVRRSPVPVPTQRRSNLVGNLRARPHRTAWPAHHTPNCPHPLGQR